MICVEKAEVCVYNQSVYIVNEFHAHIGFVVCYPLTFIVFPGGSSILGWHNFELFDWVRALSLMLA